MKLKKLVYTFIFAYLCFGQSALIGQTANFKISGHIYDFSNKQPLSFVTVILAKDSTENEIIDFATTNRLGEYQLDFVNQDWENISLNIRLLGYTSVNHVIALEKQEQEIDSLDFYLKVANYEIGEVIVSAQHSPGKIKKDTIEYNAAYYQQGDEQNLGELLDKMPGIEVDENGKVKVNGQEVNKLLIEGEEFFRDNPQISSKNLPADIVSKIQILDNYQSSATLGEFGYTEQAVNIVLNKDNKQFIIAQTENGLGVSNRYDFHNNLLRFSKKSRIGFFGDANNIGRPAFSFEEYLSFKGGLSYLNRLSTNGMINLSKDNLEIPIVANDNFKESNTLFGATNFNLLPNETTKIDGNILYYNDNRTKIKNSQNTYQFSNSPIITQESETQQLDRKLVSGHVNLTYEPSEKFNLFSSIFVNDNVFDNKDNIINEGLFTQGETNILQSMEREESGQGITSQAYYKLDSDNLINFNLEIAKKKSTHHFTLESPLIVQTFFNPTLDSSFLQSDVFISTTAQSNIGITKKLKNIFTSFDVGLSYLHNERSLTLNNDFVDIESYNNDSDYRFTNFFLKTNFKWKTQRNLLNTTFQLNFGNRTFDVFSKEQSTNDKRPIFPSLNLVYSHNINSASNLKFFVNLNKNYPDNSQLVDAYRFQSYKLIQRGSVGLELSNTYNLGLIYYYLDISSQFSIISNLNYNFQENNISYRSILDPRGFLFQSLTNFQSLSTLSGEVQFKKLISPLALVVEFIPRYSNFQGEQLIGEQFQTVKNQQVQLELGLYPSWNFPILPTVVQKFQRDDYFTGALENNYTLVQTEVKLKTAITKKIRGVLEFRNAWFREIQVPFQYFLFINYEMSAKVNDNNKLEFFFKIHNLTNRKHFVSSSFANNISNEISYTLQGRYALVGLKYRFDR